MTNTFDGISSKLDIAEGKVCVLEDIAVGATSNETHRVHQCIQRIIHHNQVGFVPGMHGWLNT